MKKFSCLWLFLCFLCSSLLAADLHLKERLKQAIPGNYLVTYQDKSFTFLFIRHHENSAIILEEVSIPASCIQSKEFAWKNWFEQGAPGHTSWTQSYLNVSTGYFEKVYSFTHKGWVNTEAMNHFMTTLIHLKFTPIHDSMRRKVGRMPEHGQPDLRTPWQPPLVVDGKRISNPYFRAYKAFWPNDRSELAKKSLEIYLLDPSLPQIYPVFFPYWIEVEGKLASGRLRVIDSGIHARSLKPLIVIP